VSKRTRTDVLIAVGLLAAAGGLAALITPKRVAPPPKSALDAIPAGALLVASADLAALRQSPVGAPFLREGREIQGLGKVRDVCGFDPLDTLAEAAIAVPSTDDAGDFGLVAAGAVDDEALVRCASKVIEARGGKPEVGTISGFRTVRDAAEGPGGGEIAVRKGGPLLLGAGVYLRSMIDAAEGRAPSVRSSRAHGDLAKRIEGAQIRVTVVLSPELRRTLVEELASGGVAGSPAASVSGGALGVVLGASVGMHGVLACDDASACLRLAGAAEEARKARSGDPLFRVLGLAPILERLALSPEGEVVHARVEVPPAQAATLAERLLALRALRRGAPRPEAPKRPPPPSRPDEIVKPDAGR
jgi:hypothetical protein